MSRGYADYLSEIDIVIYLDRKNYELWNNGESPISLGITKIDKYLYDIKILNLDDENKNHGIRWLCGIYLIQRLYMILKGRNKTASK